MSLLNAIKALDTALKALVVTEGVIEIADQTAAKDKGRESGDDPTLEAAAARLRSEPGQLEGDDMGEREAKTVVETIEVEAQYLVDRVKAILREGNVRELVIRDSKGKYLLQVPLTVGVLAGGIFALTAPAITALTAVAGLLANFRIEIERVVEDDADTPDEAADAG